MLFAIIPDLSFELDVINGLMLPYLAFDGKMKRYLYIVS